jgi:hypothetical protein
MHQPREGEESKTGHKKSISVFQTNYELQSPNMCTHTLHPFTTYTMFSAAKTAKQQQKDYLLQISH